MTRKDNTCSTSNENHDPHHCAHSKPSQVPTGLSARAPLRDRNVTTEEGGQTISTALSPESESARIVRLEAELEAMKMQCDRADAALHSECQRAPVPRREHNTAADKSIPRPSNAAKVKTEELREMLDIEKMEWNAIRMRIYMERNWKAQKPSKLVMAYNTEKFPILRQCEASMPPKLPDSDKDLMDLDNDVQDNGDEDDEPELSFSEGKKHAVLPDGRAWKCSRQD
ncbi:hypothetical protein DFH08DRAFT_804876 [Mycena albidolilacea]|uniref:Uncharacterized protein n=1 Tax=Mycena albidolilacea TaxID=1033008 RepID=A0AAD7EWP1_9AGAR|nr:hypothetical protein DFH08DRAFT_804876 [Mycena albidolilacea]